MPSNASPRRASRSGAALVGLLAAVLLTGSAPSSVTAGPSAPATIAPTATSVVHAIQALSGGSNRPVVDSAARRGAARLRPAARTAIPTATRSQPTGPAKPRVARAGHSVPPTAYRGRSHVWSSDFGLDRSVRWFPCSRSAPPAMSVYRWGCAGTNNVYLFAHAGGPFGRLHDVYVRGHLRRGMTVTYADASGIVHRYRVAWWKVVLPTDGDFAFAAQSRPSMTLQTCVGTTSKYRLVVRLYRAD